MGGVKLPKGNNWKGGLVTRSIHWKFGEGSLSPNSNQFWWLYMDWIYCTADAIRNGFWRYTEHLKLNPSFAHFLYNLKHPNNCRMYPGKDKNIHVRIFKNKKENSPYCCNYSKSVILFYRARDYRNWVFETL